MAKQSTLNERIMKFISAGENENEISIDWRALADFREHQRYINQGISEIVCDGLVDFLREKGVLVYSGKKGSYAVVGEGVLGGNIGPHYSSPGVNFNFKNLEQAKAYKDFAGRFHGQAVLPAHIVQVLD